MTLQSDAKHVKLEIDGGSSQDTNTNTKKSTEKKMQRQALQEEIVSTILFALDAFG